MIFRNREPSDKDRAKHAWRASRSRLPSVFGSPVGYLEIPIKFPSRVFPTGSSRFTNIRLPLVQESFLADRGETPPNIRNQYRAVAGSTFVAGCIFDHMTGTHLVEIFDRLQSPSIVELQLPGLLRACQQPAIRKKFMIRKL
ncbi:hypothetical protein ALC56_05817 [Trachymyrmex septentrionalis]|uniref:Uncharacterized protein n=1 Tax=Trachymyrmex septentrionalis TaxID=34720 RepID=A0A151JXD9_9HYME|nr:hypothetical protein ALC56_05817 [Trachymyrmex septentrionalis]